MRVPEDSKRVFGENSLGPEVHGKANIQTELSSLILEYFWDHTKRRLLA